MTFTTHNFDTSRLSSKLFLVITFTVIFWTFSCHGACRPDWDNQCDKDVECCSGYCHRDNPNWATGICKQRNGSTTTSKPSKTTRKPRRSTTTTSGPSSSKGPNQSGSGECSWYGDDGEIPPGSYTSCGQIFDRNAMAAAQLAGLSPKLPCGTRVRITNKANGKTVDVTINDSGTHAGRILDLTYAAFGKIENREKGVTPCSYVVI